jgi:5'(3')-deoxyribonucleotidase
MDYKIYVDLDGVLCAFKKGFKIISGGINVKDISEEELWKIIEDYGKDKFFYTLPWMDGGKELWNFIVDNFVEIKILSSIGSSHSDNDLTIKGKTGWLNKNIPLLREDDIIFVSSKHKKRQYSAPQNIIIDDDISNVKEWNESGGIGILHKNAHNTIQKLKEFI